MQSLNMNGVTVSIREHEWHGGTYTSVSVKTESGDEIEINNPPGRKGLYVSANRGEVRAYTPFPYDDKKNKPLTAAQVAELLHLTDERVWGKDRVLRIARRN